MYFQHKEVEVLSFQDEGYKTIIGFFSCSPEEKINLLKQVEVLLEEDSLENIKELCSMLLKSISFIHLFSDGLLYVIKSDTIEAYVKQDRLFEKVLAKFHFFLKESAQDKDRVFINLVRYIAFLEEEKKNALILTEEHKKVEAFVDFNGEETAQQKLEREILERKLNKEREDGLEDEEESLAEPFPLKDFKDYAWENYERKEGEFPLYQKAEEMLELNKLLLGFATFEGNPPSDLVLTFWKTYYNEKDLKEYLQETLTIQQKLRSFL